MTLAAVPSLSFVEVFVRLAVAGALGAAIGFERELRERNEMLSLAENSAGVGVWDMDMATRLVSATPQFFRILGLKPSSEPVPIELTRSVRHPDDREHVVNNFRTALESGEDQYEAAAQPVGVGAGGGEEGRPVAAGSKTPNLDQFTTNLTERARGGHDKQHDDERQVG